MLRARVPFNEIVAGRGTHVVEYQSHVLVRHQSLILSDPEVGVLV